MMKIQYMKEGTGRLAAITCEHCGREIPDNALICPACGTVTGSARRASSPATTYGTYPLDGYGENQDDLPAPTYEQGYTSYSAHAGFAETSSQPAYSTGYHQSQAYQAPPARTAMNDYPSEREATSGALIAEILCSLLGVYGVGWLMSGEKTVGTVLLICSFAVIWPLAIFIAIITFGFGIPLCDLPLAITAIIINAVLLNNRLNRKAAASPSYPSPRAAQARPPRKMPPQ
jgi:hypothetical protein